MIAAYEMLVAAIGATACWILWFYFAREYRIDSFRNELFRLRDELFNLAAEGKVPFESVAYIELRYRINGMLRFAHRINLSSTFLARRLVNDFPGESSAYDRWKASLSEIPESTSKELIRIHEQMLLAVVRHMIFGSIALMGFAVYVFAKLATKALKRLFTGPSHWKPMAHGRVQESVVRNVAMSVRASALEEEAYREEIESPELTHA